MLPALTEVIHDGEASSSQSIPLADAVLETRILPQSTTLGNGAFPNPLLRSLLRSSQMCYGNITVSFDVCWSRLVAPVPSVRIVSWVLHRILSPARLPVPPRRRVHAKLQKRSRSSSISPRERASAHPCFATLRP